MWEYIKSFIFKILAKLFSKYVKREIEKQTGKDNQIEALKDVLVKETMDKYKWKEKAEKQMKEFFEIIPPLTRNIINDTFSAIEEKYVLIPKEEILLPYPDPTNIDTDDENRLAVAAYVENYELIHDYVKREQPTWKMVSPSMETINRAGQKFFRVTKIINTAPVHESGK